MSKRKSLNMCPCRSGKFKQIAYVEYEQESSASKAVLAIDNMNLRGHNISVAISAPPSKAKTSTSGNPIKMLGLASNRKTNEQKPRISLIPNVVRKNLSSKPVTAAKPITQTTTNNAAELPKSNEDFRKLLTK